MRVQLIYVALKAVFNLVINNSISIQQNSALIQATPEVAFSAAILKNQINRLPKNGEKNKFKMQCPKTHQRVVELNGE